MTTKRCVQILLFCISAVSVIGFEAPTNNNGAAGIYRWKTTTSQRSSASFSWSSLQSSYFPQGSGSSQTHSSSLEEQITIPLVIMNFIVPGQTLHFSSSDPRFDALIQHVLSAKNSNEIGIIGLDQTTQNPLNVGVTAPLVKKDITFGINRDSERVLATSFRGTRRFEIVGEPWMDPTDSFYIANVRILDDRDEPLTAEQHQQRQLFHRKIHGLLDEWVESVIQTETLSPAGITSILKEIGPMPSDPTKRAIWVAALLNPTIPLGLCQEIRPAMLLCQNDVDRLALATVALKSSIERVRKEKI